MVGVDLAEPPAVRPSRRVATRRATPDAATMSRFELAFDEAIAGLLATTGQAPVADQLRWNFGIATDAGAPRGKRLRPRLVFAVAFEEGASVGDAIDAAIAVELVHEFSLVHDDIEDGDDLRRGRPAVWARYGLAHGINAGDAICALSYLGLLRNSSGQPAERVLAAARALQRANLAMCGGQSYDLAFEGDPRGTLEGYLAMIDGKTAALFGAACELGAIVAGADATRATAYRDVGRAYGRAFQIQDDVLGAWGTRQETGKCAGGDIARRKWSFPVAWAISSAPSDDRTIVAGHYERPGTLDCDDVRAVLAALDRLGAREAAERAFEEQVAIARALAARYQLDRSGAIRATFSPRTEAAVAIA